MEDKILELNPKQEQLGKLYDALINNERYEVANYLLANIELGILNWNLIRGNIDFDAVASVDMYQEEEDEYQLAKDLFDIALTCADKKPALFEMVDAECDKYVIMTGILAKSGRASISAPLIFELQTMYEDYKGISKRAKALGFDFIKAMQETLKEINSRVQDPEQKARWESGDRPAGEKWKKWKEQPEETLYKADYESCRLDSCGCH